MPDKVANEEPVFRAVFALIGLSITGLCAFYSRKFWLLRGRHQVLVVRHSTLTLVAGISLLLFGLSALLEPIFPEIPCALALTLQDLFFPLGITALTLRNGHLFYMMNVTLDATNYAEKHRRSMIRREAESFWLKNRWLISRRFGSACLAIGTLIGLIPSLVSFFRNVSPDSDIYTTSNRGFDESGFLCNPRFFVQWRFASILICCALSFPAVVFLFQIFYKQNESALVAKEVYLQEECVYLSLILTAHMIIFPSIGFLQYYSPKGSDIRLIPSLEIESIFATAALFWFVVIYPLTKIDEHSDENEETKSYGSSSTTQKTQIVEVQPQSEVIVEYNSTSVRIMDRQTELQILLRNPEGYEDLEVFMKRELAVENLYFWSSAQDFRQSYFQPEVPSWKPFSSEMKDHLESIFYQFVEYNSPLQLNLQRSQVENLRSVLITASLGDDISEALERSMASIEKEIITSMTHNVYKRWIKTDKGKAIREKLTKANVLI